jgi:predicted short-subunit dehydrogenase-like oxidoreductase (DUF2520 family)
LSQLTKVADSDSIVFLAIPDGAVSSYAAGLVRLPIPQRTSIVHVSGTLGLDALDALRPRHAVGSFHPLQSFPSPRTSDAFRGITVAVDASTPSLRRRLTKLARDIGARPRHVDDSQRALYHAAAVFASNYLIAVVFEGVRLLEASGWPRGEAERALLPLVEGVVANLRKRGTVGALTGPIRRGDVDTISLHVRALDRLSAPSGRAASPSGAARHLPTGGEESGPTSPQVGKTYRMLGAIALEIAKEAGLQPAAAGRIKRALTRKVAATRRRGRS